MASLQDYIDLIETPPDSAYDRVMMKAPVAEARNIPSYSERPKDGIFDYVPTREELRQGTFDVMHDMGFSPRASRKTAQTLFGTRSDSLDESAMPIPDIGAADFLTGAAAKRLVDPLLLTDAQTARLRGDAGESTLMAGLAALPPAAYVYKEVKGLSGASDQVLEDISEVDPSRRNFLKTATGVAGIAALPSALVPPVIKMGKVVTEVPGAAKVASVAVKSTPVTAPGLMGMLAKFGAGAKSLRNAINYNKKVTTDMIDMNGYHNADDVAAARSAIDNALGGVVDGERVVSISSPTGRYAEDFDEVAWKIAGEDNEFATEFLDQLKGLEPVEKIPVPLRYDDGGVIDSYLDVYDVDGHKLVMGKGLYGGDSDVMFFKVADEDMNLKTAKDALNSSQIAGAAGIGGGAALLLKKLKSVASSKESVKLGSGDIEDGLTVYARHHDNWVNNYGTPDRIISGPHGVIGNDYAGYMQPEDKEAIYNHIVKELGGVDKDEMIVSLDAVDKVTSNNFSTIGQINGALKDSGAKSGLGNSFADMIDGINRIEPEYSFKYKRGPLSGDTPVKNPFPVNLNFDVIRLPSGAKAVRINKFSGANHDALYYKVNRKDVDNAVESLK
jgi:hypothetical protein